MLVVVLPITTFPLVMKLTGSSSVAPASLLFLIPLIAILLPFVFIKKITLPVHVESGCLLFFLFAFGTILIAFLRPIPDYKEPIPYQRSGRRCGDPCGGSVFYLATVLILHSPVRIEKTLRIINWGGLFLVIWSIVQVNAKEYFPSLFIL